MKRKWKILLIGLIVLSIGIALNYENIKYLPFASTPEPETEIEPSQETEPIQEIELPQETEPIQEIELPQEAIYEKIAFVSTRIDGCFAIYSMNIDGSNQSKIYGFTIYYPDVRCYSTNHVRMIAPSPDGKKIIFVGPGLSLGNAGSGTWQDDIFLVNINGSGLIKLTDNFEEDSSPRWSPDGKKIVFSSKRDGFWQIYIMDADGSNQVRIITEMGATSPDWSPDGKKIVFTTATGLVFSTLTMNADGSNPTTVLGAIGKFPRWSPDGKKIVLQTLYTHEGTDGNHYSAWEIRVVHLNEGDLPRIVKLTKEDPLNPYGTTKVDFHENYPGHKNPSWLSDGKILFDLSFKDLSLRSEVQIWVMNVDGSNRVELTQRAKDRGIGRNQYPVWLPTT